MAATSSQSAITLPVRNLSAATSFYLSALQPLDYTFISGSQHQTAPGAASNAIGLGPRNTSVVDFWLSESPAGSATSDPLHVVFPARATLDVRNCYASALHAGGRPVQPPAYQDGPSGPFASIVSDLDGNQFEVCFSNANLQPADQPYVEGSVEGSQTRFTQPARASGSDTGSRHGSMRPSSKDAAAAPAAPRRQSSVMGSSAHPPRRRNSNQSGSHASSHGASSNKPKSNNGIASAMQDVPGGKKVVGTIIGAAAGAALAYTMVRSKNDSVDKEEEYRSRIDARDRVKSEARDHCARSDTQMENMPWRSKARSSAHRASYGYAADRDSGYYSNFSHRDDSPSGFGRGMQRFGEMSGSRRRSISAAPDDRRGSGISRRMIEHPPQPEEGSADGKQARPTPSRLGSYSESGRSHSTIRPAKALPAPPASHTSHYSTKSAKYTSHTIRPPTPPVPIGLASSESRHSRRESSSNRNSYSRREDAYAQRPDSPPGPARSTYSQRSGAPPSSYPSARNIDDRHSASTLTTRRRRASSSSQPQQYQTFSASRQAQERYSPPSAASALTAQALSAHVAQQRLPPTGSRFDELESVTPDDSISNQPDSEVGPPPERSRSFASRMASGRYAGGGGGYGRRSGLVAG